MSRRARPRKEVRHGHGERRGHDHEHAHGHVHGGDDDHDHRHDHVHGGEHAHEGHHADDHRHGHVHRAHRAHGHARRSSARATAKTAAREPAGQPPLAEHAGQGKILFLDAFSGVAGDMTVAALVDLGVPFEVVERAVAVLALDGVSVSIEPARAGSIGALRFDVRVTGRQRHRTYSDIDALLARAKLPPAVKTLARSIFRRLGTAEAAVHRIPIDEVHFHEVGAADAIVDIVSSAACIAYLGAEVVCSPLPMSRGFVDSEHGPLPLPAPATLACLRDVPTYDSGIGRELVTPTGAAIVAGTARRFLTWPSFAPERIGWGAGTMVLADRPNALRAVLGVEARSPDSGDAPTHVVVEANVDDMTGELAGHAIAELLEAGAADAWVAPVTMKKGRPGLVLSAIARKADAARIAEVVLRETSSIGVRYAAVSRIERPRRVDAVQTEFGELPVKVSAGPYGAAVVKPEFDACRDAARRHGVPVRVVIDAARSAAPPAGSKKRQR